VYSEFKVVFKNDTPQVKLNSTGLVIYLPLELPWKQEEEGSVTFQGRKAICLI